MPPPPIATLDNLVASSFADTGSDGQGWGNLYTQLDFGLDWTHTVMFGFDGVTPGGQTRVVFQAGWNDSMKVVVSCDDTDQLTLALWMTPDGGGGFLLTDSLTRSCPVIDGEWNTHALVYEAGTTTLTWYVNGQSIGSLVFDLAFFYDVGEGWFIAPPNPGNDNVPLFLGIDDSSARIFADHFFWCTRHWQAVLTPTELAAEFLHVCPQRYTDLLCDSPLLGAEDPGNGTEDGNNHWYSYSLSAIGGASTGYFPENDDPVGIAIPDGMIIGATIPASSIMNGAYNAVLWFFDPATGQKVGVRGIPLIVAGSNGGESSGLPVIADTGEIMFGLDRDVWTSDLVTNQGPSSGHVYDGTFTDDERVVQGCPFAGSNYYSQYLYFPSHPAQNPQNLHVRQIDASGAVVGSDWVIGPNASSFVMELPAVNQTETTLYFRKAAGITYSVGRYNLAGSAFLTDLYTFANHHVIGSIACDRSSGNVIVSDVFTTSGVMTVSAISSVGVLVWATTIPLADLNWTAVEQLNYPTVGATSIWLSYVDTRYTSLNLFVKSISEIRLSDGVILQTIPIPFSVFQNNSRMAVILDDIVSSDPTPPTYSDCATSPTLTFPNTPGEVGIPYSEGLVASGGTPPYGPYTITVGTLPYGLSLDADTGVISGIPTNVQTANFTAQVTDDNSQTADCLCSIAIGANMTIKSVGLIDPVLRMRGGSVN